MAEHRVARPGFRGSRLSRGGAVQFASSTACACPAQSNAGGCQRARVRVAARVREATGVHLTHELPNLALHLGGIGHLVRHKRAEDIRGMPLVLQRVVLHPAPAGAHGNGRQVWGVALGGPDAGVRVAEGVVSKQLLLEVASGVWGHVGLKLFERGGRRSRSRIVGL